MLVELLDNVENLFPVSRFGIEKPMAPYKLVLILLLTASLELKAAEAWLLGCHSDQSNNREFNIAAGNYKIPDTSPQECTSTCANLSFAFAATQGVPLGIVCFCSKTMDRVASVADAKCNAMCNSKVCEGPAYLRVYSTANSIEGLSISSPNNGNVFDEISFKTSLTKGDLNSSFTFNFGDGSFVLSTCSNTSHKYTRAGSFQIEVAARNNQSGPIYASRWLTVKSPMGQTGIVCPRQIMETGNKTKVSMYAAQGTQLSGKWIEISDGSRTVFQMADAVMYDIGSSATFGNISGSPQAAGVYVMPTATFKREGYIVAWELNAAKVGGIHLQVFRPTCPSLQTYCLHSKSCIPSGSNCNDSGQFTCPGQGSVCVSTGHCLSGCLSQNITYPDSATPLVNYTLVSDGLFNISKLGYQLVQLQKCVHVTSGDVIGWAANGLGDLAFEETTSDPEYYFPSSVIGSVMETTTGSRQNIKHVLRAHFSQTAWATRDYVFNSAGWHAVSVVVEGEVNNSRISKLETCAVSVQERLENLRISTPKCYVDDVSYAANQDIELSTLLDKGSNVTYQWNCNATFVTKSPAGAEVIRISSPGLYQLTLYAYNNISAMGVTTTFSVLTTVGTITLLSPAPNLPVLDVGAQGNYSFSLSKGGNVTVWVEFDGVEVNRTYIDEANDTVFSVSYTFQRGGKLSVVAKADNNIAGIQTLSLTQYVKGKIGDILIDVKPERTADGVLEISTNQEYEVYISSSLSIPINYTIDTGSEGRVFIETTEGKTVKQNRYKEPYEGNITIIASANGESYEFKIPVSIKVCGPPAIYFPVANDIDSKYTFTRGNMVTLKSRAVKTQNPGCDSAEVKYDWMLSGMDGTPDVDLTDTHAPSLVIYPRALFKGNYSVNLTVTYAANNLRYLYKTYLDVRQSLLIARIVGGNPRDVPFETNKKLNVDGGESLDPDDPTSALSYSWTCRRHNDSITSAIYDGLITSKPCSSLTFTSIDSNLKKLQMPLPSFIENTTYEFQLEVSKKGRTSTCKQLIKIVPEESPAIVIQCRSNCKLKVNPQDRLILQANCENCNSTADLSATWTLLNSAHQPDSLHGNMSITTTGFNTMGIVIKSESLRESTVYYLRLEVTRRTLSVFVVHRIETTIRPRDGNCIALPTVGTAAIDQFTVECNKWRTEDYPLSYEFYYVSKRTDEAQIDSLPMEAQVSTVWYEGRFRKTPASVLPVGDENRNHLLPLVVKIYNFYGAFTNYHLNVTVKPQEPSLEVVTKMKARLTENSVDASADPQKAFQLVTSVASILNIKTTQQKSAAHIEENTKLRSQCVDIAVKAVVEELPQINEGANAVAVSISDENEVTSETQIKAVDFLKKVSAIVKHKAQKTGYEATSADKIEESAQSIFTGVSHILKASSKTTEDYVDRVRSESENKTEGSPSRDWSLRIFEKKTDYAAGSAQLVVSTTDTAIDELADAIQRNKLPSENSTRVRTKTFNMELQKKQLTELGNKNIPVRGVDGQAAGSFVLPPASELLSENDQSIGSEDYVDVQAIFFNNNPVTWDKANSPYMASHVISLELRKNDKTLNVANTRQDIEIEIPVTSSTSKRYSNVTFGNKRFYSHHYRITNGESLQSPLMIHVKPDEPLTLFVSFGSKATTNNYDLKVHLPCLNITLPWPFHRVDNHSVLVMDLEYFGNKKSNVYLGLKATDLEQEVHIPASSSGGEMVSVTSSFFATYEVDVRTAGCKFWSESDTDKWKNEGCTLSNKTTLTMTRCLCNHLTFFGSFVVAPNPIGPLTIEDFKRGYALFVFVAVIYLIYFIGLIWARRKDRSDLVKVGVSPLPDNDPTDQFRYEITIWTSMRRGAGTTSKVSMILYGEDQDTEARALDDSERPPFQRGCVNTFLLTTPSNLGPLPYIRIWHDNSGGSWFLSRVMVVDLQSDDRYYFICNRWLAVDEEDGQVERLIPLASREELTEFQHLFVARTRRNLSDSHLWFSVLARPANSRFTRVQRLSCCLCLMMMSMMTNAMWYNAIPDPEQGSAHNFAGFLFTKQQLFIGIVSSLIVFPVNLILVQIFRSVRPKPQRIRHKKSPNLPRLSLTVQNLTHYNRMKDSSEDSKGSNNSIDSTQEKNARLRLSINDVHTDVDRLSFTSSPLLIDNRRRSTMWEQDGSRFRRFVIWLKKAGSLPFYFVYVAWGLVFIFSMTGAIVVILYGMTFGNAKSLQWLTSSIVSFIQDVLITQPLKVLLTAVFFALVIKKPDKAEFEIPSEAAQLAEDEDWLYSMANNNRKSSGKSKMKLLPPDQAKLNTMRSARMRERKMYSIIREIGFFYFFMCLVLMIAYTHKDHMAFVQTKEFKEMFSNDFYKIQTDPEFWNWTRQDLLPNLFPTRWYNGKPIPSNGFLSDHNSQMVGGARLRLIRVKPGICEVPRDVTFITQKCYAEYTVGDDDELDYLPAWANVTTYNKPISDKDVSWRYQNWIALDGYPFMANVSTYAGGGYILVLEPGMNNMDNLARLERSLWLDRQTRAIITEFTTYNAQTNLFSIVTLAAEFPATGGVIPFVKVQTARLYDFTSDVMYFVLAFEFVFVLFILFFSYKEARLIFKQGLSHFKEFWNITEFIINVSALVGIGLYIYRMLTIKDVVTRSKAKPFNFMSFQFAGYWDDMYTFTIAIMVTFATIKLNKLLRFNRRMSLLSSTLKHAAFPLAMFGVIIGIIFLAFTLISTVVFGTDMQGYRSTPKSFTSLLSLMLGKASFLGMYESNRILGPLVFFMFMFLVSMVLINMFLSIVIDAFHVVRRDIAKQSNEYEIVDFIIDRFKLWAGIGKVPRPRRGERRVLWDMAASKVKAIQAFNNSSLSLDSDGLDSDHVSDLENRLEKLIKRTDLLYSEIFPEKLGVATKGKLSMKTTKI